MSTGEVIRKSVLVHAPAGKVWEVLTDTRLMPQWMSDAPMAISTDWIIGHAIRTRGDLHGLPYENKGIILDVQPRLLLRYSHWSSLSEIADQPEHYATIAFQLQEEHGNTLLTLTHSHFPLRSIYEHSNFYWNSALGALKRIAEMNVV